MEQTGSAAARWGGATGNGSLPGEDPLAAARLVFDLLPDFPHLPELPGRGPGADLLGRTAALLPDLHIDLQPAGWRFVDRPGRDERRAASFLAYDLDALEEVAAGHSGPLKIQLAGPWTLAAGVELTRGNAALSDPGAVRDIVASLAEAVRTHCADIRRRIPGAELVLQLDEPTLPAVLAGRLPTPSGWGRVAAVEPHLAQESLATVARAALTSGTVGGVPLVVHCCAAEPPIALLRAAGATAVSVDLGLMSASDALPEAIEAGVTLFAGVVASSESAASASGTSSARMRRPQAELSESGSSVLPAAAARQLRRMWQRWGFAPEGLTGSVPRLVVVTPTCGLAGATPSYARAAMSACREAARRLNNDPEGDYE